MGKNKVSRTVVAITDFSVCSTNAIRFAVSLFKNINLKLIFLNVFENSRENNRLLISVEDILLKESQAGLKKQTDELKSILSNREEIEKGLSISSLSIPGKLNKAIAKIIETEDVDLIVSGVPADKYPSKWISNNPILFVGQTKQPVLMVPGNCTDKPVRSILALNFDSTKHSKTVRNDFEHLVNHNHISKHSLSINEKRIESNSTDKLQIKLKKHEGDLIILIPAPGDKIDRALHDYRVNNLVSEVNEILSV